MVTDDNAKTVEMFATRIARTAYLAKRRLGRFKEDSRGILAA